MGGAGRFRGQEKGLSMGQGLLVCYSPRASSPATGRAGFLQQERDRLLSLSNGAGS